MARKRKTKPVQYSLDFSKVEYDEAVKAIQSVINNDKGDDISEKEADIAVAALSAPNADKIREMLGFPDLESLNASITESLHNAGNGENYFQTLRDRIKRGEVASELASGFGALNDMTEALVGTGQIRASRKTLDALSRPQLPEIPKRDEKLSKAISDAQAGTFDTARQLQPMRETIERGYGADLQTARSVAGGQAGAYGALGQTAAIRRNQALSGMAPMIDSIRAREQARLDNLLGMRQDENQRNFGNRMYQYNQSNSNYDVDRAYAEDRLAAGQSNLFGGLRNFGNNLAVLGSKYYDKPAPQFSDIFRKRQKIASSLPETQAMDETLSNDPYLAPPTPTVLDYYNSPRY